MEYVLIDAGLGQLTAQAWTNLAIYALLNLNTIVVTVDIMATYVLLYSQMLNLIFAKMVIATLFAILAIRTAMEILLTNARLTSLLI